MLLIMSAEGLAADAQLAGRSEVEVGYWTGSQFRFMRSDDIARLVSHWAVLGSCIPETVKLKYERKFESDVRE